MQHSAHKGVKAASVAPLKIGVISVVSYDCAWLKPVVSLHELMAVRLYGNFTGHEVRRQVDG